ncbi:MAG: PD40 domain-containing protein, partial [Bacteroidetes bacterium]|nr:PD40 domain-containing protein [Bacteroidota bacterium]
IKNPVNFDPTNLGDNINSANDEYWPTPSLDGKKLIFTRLLKGSNRLPQEDFFEAGLDSLNQSKAIPLTNVNTTDNEGAQTLSADSKILFFTACNRPDGGGSCDIYFSRFVNGKWTTPLNAGSPLNTQYWDAQPSFSSDNRFLYFSSNRPGGKGKKDIWKVEFVGFSDTGIPTWKEPENIKEINTAGDEISPFIHANNQNFYFASDTHVGMGGLDLFTAYFDESGSVEDLKNLGYPINTHEDELGITISSIGNKAYFSSARNTGAGLDIFSFNLTRGLQPKPVTYVKAKVTDKSSKVPVQAKIELVNLSSRSAQVRVENADENGEIMLCLPLSRNYAFNVSEKGFLFFSKSILLANSNSLTDPYNLDIELESIEVGAEMDLYNIYYETDSFIILSESEPELQNLVLFLQNNSDLKVEIQGHTDSSGNAENNKQLSELRAKSVVDYLVTNGIQISRLLFAGYGDTVPISTNETPEGRRENRRTTIKILEK